MGIGHITEARETAGGTVRDGGASAKVATGGGFDPLRANVDPFKARSIQIESLRPIAEAMRKHELATTAIEKASATRADIDEIRNGLPEGEHAGMWKDDAGVWRPALNNEELIRRKFETENTMGVSFEEYRKGIFDLAKNTIKRRKDQRLAGETNDVRAFVNRETGEDIVAFEGDCEEALLVSRIGENFARAQASVASDAGAMNSTALGRIGSDNAKAKVLMSAGMGAEAAAGAAKVRTDLWARQYVRQSLEGRMKAAVVLASQSGGLMSPAAAMKKANAIYDGQASELMRRLVEALQADSRFRISSVDALRDEVTAAMADRTVTYEMLPDIRASLEKNFRWTDAPVPLSVADCFFAARHFLFSREPYHPGKVHGFLYEPEGRLYSLLQ